MKRLILSKKRSFIALALALILVNFAQLFDMDDTRTQQSTNRRLQEPSCFTQMLQNGDFELDGGSLSEWSIQGSGTKTLVEEGGSHAVYISDRRQVHNGIVQNAADAIPCLSGSGFYIRLTARARLYDPITGSGVWSCTHDHFYVARMWAWLNCPFFRISTFKGGEDENVFEVHDSNMEWDSSTGAWNNLDIVVKVPESHSGEGISHFYVSLLGGPSNTNMEVDNVVMKRLEEADIPEGHPIFDPTQSTRDGVDCSDNIIINGDGEYQSPFMWDSYGNWFSPTTLDVRAPGYDGTGYSLISYNRVHVLNGIGQHFSHVCFVDSNYYIRIVADIMLYDQTTGSHITACSNEYTQTKQMCPFIDTVFREPGRVWKANYYDTVMTENWHSGWNKMDIIVAFSPGNAFTNFQVVKMAFVGGPPGSVLKMDNSRIYKIPYEDIPAGQEIWDITGQLSTSPIKTCHSTGDPHLFSFGGNRFDNHTEGWVTLYNYTVGSHRMTLETSQRLLPSGLVAMNNGVRVTYDGTVYQFQNGEFPVPDIYYEHRELDEKLVFPEPHIKVFIQGGPAAAPINYFYNIWITTYAAIDCTGMCCDVEGDAPVESSSESQVAVVFPDNAPTQEEGEAACKSIEDEQDRQDCIFDFRMIVSEIITDIEVNGNGAANGDADNTTQDFLAAGLEFLSRSYEPAQAFGRLLEQDTQADNYYFLTGESILGPSVQGDPTIVGLQGQRFKFDGRGGAWYANLAAESLQWNMKFHKFEDCPTDENIYVTGISIQIRESRRLVHNVIIRVREEDSFFPGCGVEGDGSVCLGEGSLEVIVNGNIQRIPGDYFVSSDNGDGGIRVIAHNTYDVCSRMWHDYIIPQQGDIPSQESGNRRLSVSQETPLSFLSEGLGQSLNPKICAGWIRERAEYDDLFLQPGGWSSIDIETPLASFHAEYRQNLPDENVAGSCHSHNIDAWMSKVSPKLESQKWRGILGETRHIKTDKATGSKIMNDRDSLLVGGRDSDYEVSGPYGTHFNALDMSPWYREAWDGLKELVQ